jgi:hypothetical protein
MLQEGVGKSMLHLGINVAFDGRTGGVHRFASSGCCTCGADAGTVQTFVACLQLATAEASITELKAEKKALVQEQQALNEKIRRGGDAVAKTAQLQERLESKLLKLSVDKEAAERNAAAATKSVKNLEARHPRLCCSGEQGVCTSTL